MHEFDLETEALGRLRCASLTLNGLATLEETLKDAGLEGLALARRVLTLTGKKVHPPEGDNIIEEHLEDLTEPDVEQLTEEELETFAREFLAHNGWLLHFDEHGERPVRTSENDEPIPKALALPKQNGERDSGYLTRVLRRYLEDQRTRLSRMMAPLSGILSKNLFSDATQGLLRQNFGLSDQLGDTIKAFDNALQATKISRPPLELAEPRFTMPDLPEHPAFETNRRLNDVIDYIEAIRPIASQSASLIHSMNDVALRMQADFIRNTRRNEIYTRIIIGIAAASLVLTAMFSWWSYTDAHGRAEESARLLKAYQAEIQVLTQAQDERLEELIRAVEAGTRDHANQEKPKSGSDAGLDSVTNDLETGGETMAKDSKTTLRGRDAKTGEFIPVKEARQRPVTTTVERVPKPGHGDTGRGKKR